MSNLGIWEIVILVGCCGGSVVVLAAAAVLAFRLIGKGRPR